MLGRGLLIEYSMALLFAPFVDDFCILCMCKYVYTAPAYTSVLQQTNLLLQCALNICACVYAYFVHVNAYVWIMWVCVRECLKHCRVYVINLY